MENPAETSSNTGLSVQEFDMEDNSDSKESVSTDSEFSNLEFCDPESSCSDPQSPHSVNCDSESSYSDSSNCDPQSPHSSNRDSESSRSDSSNQNSRFGISASESLDPTDATCEQPTDATCEQPTDATWEQPTDATCEQLTDATCEQLTDATCEQLTDATSEHRLSNILRKFLNDRNLFMYRLIVRSIQVLTSGNFDIATILASSMLLNPVPQTKLNTIPIRKLTESELQKHNTCSICLKDFNSETEIMLLACEHAYHEECITPWFKRAEECP